MKFPAFEKRLTRIAVGVAFTTCLTLSAPSQTNDLRVSVNRAKVERGQNVEIYISGRGAPVQAVLLTPNEGSRTLPLRPAADGSFAATIPISSSSSAGLYVVHAWIGERSNPTAVGKSSFRVGNIVADFFVANYVDKENPANDLDAYLKDFRGVGGNFLIAHNLIITTGAFYPSKIAKTNGTGNDLVELLLDRADRQGIPILLSVSWDMTRNSPFKERMSEIRAIASELYKMYRHHPSLAGFYSYQEGSGTYYAPFVREFSEHIKSLDAGLLTACAPHIDDPLLAGYLSVIEELDMMIYQSAVMASYRPDNRKEYPLRRVRDFSGLGAGAKRLQNKITLTHVELFAYMEKRLRPEVLTASYSDIYGQILSAATVTDTDGISLFSYHAHIFDQSKRFEAGKIGRSAVENGVKVYESITADASRNRLPLALYIPYSDFVIERWNNYFLPALDAFRHLGVPIDILPYAPPLAESVYPYYPFHMNEDVLKRLLRERVVLVLANVSGFQQTDSDLIKAFVEAGGVVVAFGSQIPYGRSYERKDLFGGDQSTARSHTSVSSGKAIMRFPGSELPTWRPTTAKVVAKYEDGSAAILMNKFGKGTTFMILPDARFSAAFLPEMVRTVLNTALRLSDNPPLVEITGTDENMDVAVRQTHTTFAVTVVNHNPSERRIGIKPSVQIAECRAQTGTARPISVRPDPKTNRIVFSVPKNEALILDCN